MVTAMRTADDLFFDIVSQIHLPRWSAASSSSATPTSSARVPISHRATIRSIG
jgi:hypothetical protein